MTKVSVREARENLRALIDRVAAGEQVVLLRRGKEVARLVPPVRDRRRLPGLESFRGAVALKGKPMSSEVIDGRDGERY